VAFDYSKLVGRIIEKYGSRKAFAKAYGISENTMSQKLNGKMSITTDDIVKMSSREYLDIDASKIPAYFFTEKVQVN
jgi:transcriptional regulator with XRE-family HTH domain